MELVGPGELGAGSAAAVAVLAFAVFQVVRQAAPGYWRCALAVLGRT
ncbi:MULTISPECIES: hypothetical protein [Streptomyces]|nr:hypothetical protein [Streptomyces sp. NEAU-383]